MPLYLRKRIQEKGEILIWELTESDDQLSRFLNLSEQEISEIKEYTKKRRQEWLGARLLTQMSIQASWRQLRKDKYGKPYLENHDDYISLSHSDNKVAFIRSPYVIGIDIQKHVEKITRIQHKYLCAEEIEQINNTDEIAQLHIYWGAKESMYKGYGRKGIEFSIQMKVAAFEYNSGKNIITSGTLKKNNVHQSYKIYGEKIDDLYLVYAVHNSAS